MASRYWRLDGFGGVDLLRADASSHRYARHSHEGYALGVVEAGAHAFAARGAVATAREHLEAHFAEDLSLAELAARAGVDRFHLLRAFRRALGLPPHLYQTQLRLRHAKQLMLAGEPPAMAAAAAGFADQSHLIRKFKAAYGVTPGQYLGGTISRAAQ